MMIHRHGPRGRESNNTGQRHCRKHLRGHECVHNHRRSTGAINQLAANQTHILQQMAAMSIAAPPPRPLWRRRSTSLPSPTWQSSQGGFGREVVQQGVADMAGDVGGAGSALDAAEIPLQCTWRPLAVARGTVYPPIWQTNRFPRSCNPPTHAATTAAL